MEIFDSYKDVEIVYCRSCKKVYYRQRLLPLKEFKKAFTKYIKEHIRFNNEPDEFYVDTQAIENLEDPPKETVVPIMAISGEEKDEAEIPVTFRALECPNCSRLKGGYYEGILQLRNTKNEMFSQCKEEIENTVEKKELVAISHKKKVKGGIDFYITDKKYIKSLGTYLHKKYGGDIKTSPELFSEDRQSSKKIYRVNVLLRLPDFNIGDIVEYETTYYKIAAFISGKATAVCLKTGKSRPIDLSTCSKVAGKEDYYEVIVTKKMPNVEILHPQTYESTPVENLETTEEKELKVVILDEKVYAV